MTQPDSVSNNATQNLSINSYNRVKVFAKFFAVAYC